jgi:NADH dehydrogenase
MVGADALINTYWVRLPYAGQTFDTAVENSRLLLQAAAAAGVRRVVHLSVSNASAGTNLGYYRGKAEVEQAVRALGVPFAIVRPTLVVGPADVLTNNIAWFLRRFPLFPLPAGRRLARNDSAPGWSGATVPAARKRTPVAKPSSSISS